MADPLLAPRSLEKDLSKEAKRDDKALKSTMKDADKQAKAEKKALAVSRLANAGHQLSVLTWRSSS